MHLTTFAAAKKQSSQVFLNLNTSAALAMCSCTMYELNSVNLSNKDQNRASAQAGDSWYKQVNKDTSSPLYTGTTAVCRQYGSVQFGTVRYHGIHMDGIRI